MTLLRVCRKRSASMPAFFVSAAVLRSARWISARGQCPALISGVQSTDLSRAFVEQERTQLKVGTPNTVKIRTLYLLATIIDLVNRLTYRPPTLNKPGLDLRDPKVHRSDPAGNSRPRVSFLNWISRQVNLRHAKGTLNPPKAWCDFALRLTERNTREVTRCLL
jgi:hypothetical protein